TPPLPDLGDDLGPLGVRLALRARRAHLHGALLRRRWHAADRAALARAPRRGDGAARPRRDAVRSNPPRPGGSPSATLTGWASSSPPPSPTTSRGGSLRSGSSSR